MKPYDNYGILNVLIAAERAYYYISLKLTIKTGIFKNTNILICIDSIYFVPHQKE